MVLAASPTAAALNPDLQISQYAHSAWRMRDGAFSGTPARIAQTTDGYLWIGTNVGLVRFDGVRFVAWNPPAGQKLHDWRIFSLLGASDGSLWIGTGYSVSRWKNGNLTDYPQISGRIESLVEDKEGAVWLVRTQITDGMGPVCRMKDDQVRCFGKDDAYPFDYATKIVAGEKGELWIAGYSELCQWKPGAGTNYSQSLTKHPPAFSALGPIAPGKDGSVWAAVYRADLPIRLDNISSNGNRSSLDIPGIPVSNSDIISIFVDRDNAVWIGTAGRGIYRAQGSKIEHFGSAEGLSGDAVQGFFPDAEGTMWVVTSEGIDSFHDVRVVTYTMNEGLSAAGASSVVASRDGTIWIGNFQALDFLRNGHVSGIHAGQGWRGRSVTTLMEDHAGKLWVGVDSGLWVYDKGRFQTVGHADGSPLGTIFAIAEDIDHDVWVRAGPNLDRIQGLKLQEERTSKKIATAYTMAANPAGGLILGSVDGSLIYYKEDGTSQSIPTDETGNTRQIRDLLVDADGSVWGTNVDELARWKDGQRKNLTVRNGLPCDQIFALIKDRSEAIWLYTRCGLVQISKSELDRWWQHPDTVVKVRLLDEFDGVQPGLASLKPQTAMSPDGHLWFVNTRALQTFDPAHIERNSIPPPVHIEEVVADRRSYSPGAGLQLPALTRDLEIDYTAPSFVAARGVRFRYRLEGRDTSWEDPGTRRQAFYSDLPPARYSFHVIASNHDGVWNETGAVLDFRVLPAVYQTVWFRVAVSVLVIFAIWALYLVRMRQMTEEIQGRLSERLVERERIARELHDTLLQGFQGLLLRFQAVMKQLPKQGPAHQMMEQALDRADEVLLEGRQRVRDLRSESTALNELSQTLKDYGTELAKDGAATFTLAAVGTPRPLNSIVFDESYRVGREALVNAFRHSRASVIEAEITYARGTLRLRVRDDGIGMDQTLLNNGRAGHWGLSGMRERAERIGGQLNIWSNPGAGTEIDLTVPARVAYSKGPNEKNRRRASRSANAER